MNLSFLLTLLSLANPVFHNLLTGILSVAYIKELQNQDYFYGMMTSSNGNIFHITGLLRREFTGQWWIPHTKASDAELWCFVWSAREYTIE